MKRKLVFLLSLLISVFSFAQNQEVEKIIVDANEKVATISPLFWGTNFLFWIENDEALANGKIIKLLKDLPCPILRYPGGTVADNFHWKTTTLDNKAMFPYSDGDDKTSFDEFMSICKQIGAEPQLVVNTQSWALKGDIKGGAKEAADWVKYCKDKGYKVKYWEIGNETYWHPVMTAKEYAQLFNEYAKAMKSIDPNIVLSVNGHWSVEFTGNKERTDKKYWEKAKKDLLSVKSREDTSRVHAEHQSWRKGKSFFKGSDKWWNDIFDGCGKNIDMISIHWYYTNRQLESITPRINEVKALFKKKFPKRDIPICLSEYNCNTEETVPRVLGFAESIGRFLETGIKIGNFWPTRMSGMTKRSMFNIKSNDPQYPYTIFKIFSKELTGDIVRSKYPKNCYAFASSNGKEMTVIISGRNFEEEKNVEISIKNFKFKSAEGMVYSVVERPNPNIKGVFQEVKVNDQILTLKIPPLSFATIRLNQ